MMIHDHRARRTPSHRVSTFTAIAISLLLAVTACADDDEGDAANSVAPTSGVPVDASASSPATTEQSATQTDAPTTATDSAPTSTAIATSTEPAAVIDPACAQLQEPISSLDVDVAGEVRTTQVHMPAGTPPLIPSAVVLSFHGAGDSTGGLAEWDGLKELSDREGFIVLHPQGTAREVYPGVIIDPGWDILRLHVDDSVFVAALLDDLATRLCVDPARVYATGLSLGGSFSLHLSCSLGDRIAAIATVAAGPLIYACPNPQPIPTLMFHGLEDLYSPYAGDPANSIPSVEQGASDVAVRNGCAATAPIVTTATPGVDRLTWEGCAASTELYRISPNGHAWPGGHVPPGTRDELAVLLTEMDAVPAALTPEQAADNIRLSHPDIDATEVMWEFFNSQG